MPLLIHHLQVSQSERLPWLCEELEIDYSLKLYQRAPILAPPEYKNLHPMGAAPVIQDGDLTLAESCACIEYICHKYGQGRLFLSPKDHAYADFLYWWHWADGTFQPGLSRALLGRPANSNDGGSSVMAKIAKERFEKALKLLDERLRDNIWLAGADFTVADIMVVFSLTTMRYFAPFGLQEYKHTLRYLDRVGQRPAYQRAMKRSDPAMELALGPKPPARSA